MTFGIIVAGAVVPACAGVARPMTAHHIAGMFLQRGSASRQDFQGQGQNSDGEDSDSSQNCRKQRHFKPLQKLPRADAIGPRRSRDSIGENPSRNHRTGYCPARPQRVQHSCAGGQHLWRTAQVIFDLFRRRMLRQVLIQQYPVDEPSIPGPIVLWKRFGQGQVPLENWDFRPGSGRNPRWQTTPEGCGRRTRTSLYDPVQPQELVKMCDRIGAMPAPPPMKHISPSCQSRRIRRKGRNDDLVTSLPG